MTWLPPWEERAAEFNHIRGLWGLFLDGLQAELRELRRDCLAAEPGPEADFAYDCYRAHLDVMGWASGEIERLYLADRWKVVVDWSWDSTPHPPASTDTYEGDHTLGVE